MTDAPTDRLDALARTRELLPHLDVDTQMRVAEWSVTGSAALDPDAVEAAARVLATERDSQSTVRSGDVGLAARAVRAYVEKAGS